MLNGSIGLGALVDFAIIVLIMHGHDLSIDGFSFD